VERGKGWKGGGGLVGVGGGAPATGADGGGSGRMIDSQRQGRKSTASGRPTADSMC
jgi:hypothetical protein